MHRYHLPALLLTLLLLAGCAANPTAGPVSTAQTEPLPVATEDFYGCRAEPLGSISKKELTQRFLRAREDGARDGYIPVVVCVNDTLTELLDYYFETAGGPEAYAEAVLQNEGPDGSTVLEARYAELEALIGADYLAVRDDEIEAAGRGKQTRFPSVLPGSGEKYLVQVPVEQPWEIFARIPFCGWNSCPEVDEMISVCRYWNERYRAVPAMISYDMLILYLPEPVTDLETAKALAKEQVAFCDGVFEAGGPGLYAAAVLDSNFWSFWWD